MHTRNGSLCGFYFNRSLVHIAVRLFKGVVIIEYLICNCRQMRTLELMSGKLESRSRFWFEIIGQSRFKYEMLVYGRENMQQKWMLPVSPDENFGSIQFFTFIEMLILLAWFCSFSALFLVSRGKSSERIEKVCFRLNSEIFHDDRGWEQL